MIPHVLVAGLAHESNGFVAGSTPLSAFRVRRGGELLACRGDRSPLDGMLAGGERHGWLVTPAGSIEGWPSAPADDAVLDAFVDLVRAAVASATERFDGVLLAMHGAMLSTAQADAEGAVVARLRGLPALAGVPMVAAFDLHGNPSAAMCAGLDAVAVFRRNPHDDTEATGARAAGLLDRLMRARRRGACVVAHAGVVWPPIGTGTADEPMRTLEAAARAVEAADPALLEVAVFAGFAYADHPDVGVAVCVSTLADPAVARARADELAAIARRDRRVGDRRNASPEEALRAIAAAPPGPVVLAEPSDNIGAGTRGDATALLRLLLEHPVGGIALVAIADAAAVAALADARPGARRRLALGGRGWHGDAPVEREWTLVSRSDGAFALEDPRSPLAALCGQAVAMGPCVVVAHREVRVLVTTRATPPWDLGFWRSQGLAPEQARVIAVKSAVAHRLAYQGIAVAMISVETPGPCPTDLSSVPYARLRRPIHPLDPS